MSRGHPANHDDMSARNTGGISMTEKELLYVEDALGHEQYCQTQCCQTANQLQDRELRSFAEDIERQHKNIFQNFYDLL